MRVHVMYPVTYRTSHRLIDVAVFRRIFGNKALNGVSGYGAAVDKQRHAEYPLDGGAGGRGLNRDERLGQNRPPGYARNHSKPPIIARRALALISIKTAKLTWRRCTWVPPSDFLHRRGAL